MSSPMAFETPCDADLGAMPSFDGGKRRFCSQCMRSVHMLSEMTREQASAFMRDNRDACMSYERGEDGRVVFRGEEPGFVPRAALSRRTRSPRPRALAATPLVAALAACSTPVVEAEQIVEDEMEQVERAAFASYMSAPEAAPCETAPEPEAKPKRKRNNERLVENQIAAIGHPGHYAGGLSLSDINPDSPFGGGGASSWVEVELGSLEVEGADEINYARVVTHGAGELQQCLRDAGIGAGMGGLSVRVVVDATGRVLRSKASFEQGGSAACVEEVISQWSFPEPREPSATLTLRYSLS